MKSFFSSRVSKFNASMTLCLLGVSTLSLPVMAAPQEACMNTSTGDVGCGEIVPKLPKSNQPSNMVVVGFAGVPLAHSVNKPVRLLAQATQSDNKPVQLLAQDPRTPQGVTSTERVRFAQGASSTNLTREIAAYGEAQFFINARKGQTMEYKVTTYNSDVSVAEVFVFDMASNKIVSESGPDELNSFVVEKSGDTSLTVRNKTGKTISISLYLDIQDKALQDKARLIYPDAPGTSKTCVVPVDPATNRFKLALLSELKLIDASAGGQCELFVASKQRISIIGHPDLCVNIAAGASRGVLYLEACRDVSVTGWDIKATAAESSRLRSLGGPFDNMCWAIPNLADGNAKFPLRVQPALCQKNVDNELKFFIE
jgi:hypothetical protein